MTHIRYTLPSPPTEIIGREREADELRKLLLAEDVRLVTLTGPGGMGKTRLAIHTASLMTDNFDDGVYFVPLAHVGDSALFFLTLAQLLDIQSEPGQPVQQPVLRYFRQREVLLVLDNFEQIVGAAADVALLLSSCPRLTILVTSRIVLHVRGEHEYPVLPLALPAVNVSMEVEALSHYASVLLFVQRATAVRPDFRLTLSNAAAIAEICLRLDGLPLAIELAAARTKLLTPQAMLPRLQHRLQLLRGGAVDLPERQQTLYNTIRWSYELLDGQEQQLFRSLSVFQGYWNLDAATAIVQMEDIEVEEVLLSLVNKSMVQQREMPNGDIFFTLLETLREFALEQLQQTGHATSIHERHANYYIQLAGNCTISHPDEEFRRWTNIVSTSFDNMRATFRWLLNTGHREKAALLFVSLDGFWYGWNTTEGELWLEQILPFVESFPPAIAYRIYQRSGFFRSERGETSAPIADFEKALELLPPDEHHKRYTILVNIAYNCHLTGDIRRAEELYIEAVAGLRTDSNPGFLIRALPGYAELLRQTGRPEQAILMLEEVAGLMRSHNIRRGLPGILVALISLYGLTALDKISVLIEEALLLCQEFGDRRNEMRVQNILAGMAIQQERYSDTGLHLYRALQLQHEINTPRLLPALLLNMTYLFLTVSATTEATHLLAYTDAFMRTLEVDFMTIAGPIYLNCLERLKVCVAPEKFEQLWSEGEVMTPATIHVLIRSTLEQYTASETPSAVPRVFPVSEIGVDTDLTTREKEILRLLAQGLSNKEIGEKLFISMRTVHAHVRSIYSKINVSSRSAATRFAIERSL